MRYLSAVTREWLSAPKGLKPCPKVAFVAIVVAQFLAAIDSARAGDWPTFNHDNARSGVTSEQLDVGRLKESWTWQSPYPPQSAWPGPARWDAFANIRDLPSMRNYDPAFHLAVVGDALYFGSSADDSVRSLDARNGAERWITTVDAPVRIAPAVSDGRVYFGSDDGHAYCVGAGDGKLVWKFNPRPGRRLVLNDGRLISFWPVRTSVMVDGGTAYFASALLPWDPSYLCAVDAATGKPEGPGRYVREYATNMTFEGPLLCSASKIVVPQGRVPPILFDRKSGDMLGPLDGAGGGCFVLLTPKDQVIHGPGNRAGQLVATSPENRSRVALFPHGRAMVVTNDVACLLKLKSVHLTDAQFKAQRWQVDGEYVALVIAGDTVILGGTDEVVALAVADGSRRWRAEVDGRAFGLAVADGALFVSTDTGTIHCFRPDASAPAAQVAAVEKKEAKPARPPQPAPQKQALKLASGPSLKFVDPTTAVVHWETETPVPTVLEVALADETQTIAEPAPKLRHEARLTNLKRNRTYVCTIRTSTEEKGGGESFTFDCDTEFNFTLPTATGAKSPFDDASQALFADAAKQILALSGVEDGIAVVVGCGEGRLAYELATRTRLRVIGLESDQAKVAAARAALIKAGLYGGRVAVMSVENLGELPLPGNFANLVVSESPLAAGKLAGSAAEMFRIVRPAGGVLCLGQPAAATSKLSGQELRDFLIAGGVSHVNQAKLAGLWAHVVRGRLPGAGEWTHQYGRADNSAYGGEQLAGATDAEDFIAQWVGRPGPRFQSDRNGRKPGPLAVAGRLFAQGMDRILAIDAYNGSILWSREIPGLLRMNVPRDSSNWCADGKHIYAVVQGECWQLDAGSGEITRKYAVLPGDRAEWKYDWSYVGNTGPLLVGSAVKQGTTYRGFWGGGEWYDAPQGPEAYKVLSENLFALDKDSGSVRWRHDGLVVNSTVTIGGDGVYFVECRHPTIKSAVDRRVGSADLWRQQFMVALDVKSGKKLWEKPLDTHHGHAVFFLAHSGKALVLVSSGSGAFHVYAFRAEDGRPIWDHRFGWPGGKADHGKAMSRPAIVGDRLFVRPMTFELMTGKVLPQTIPGGGCGTYACAAGSLLFRAGHVTIWDAKSGNVSAWPRLRPGCWLSTIPAEGLILSPEAGGGCSCGNWMETSIALAPRSYYPTPRFGTLVEVFSKSLTVPLECWSDEGVIRYTTDGSEPTSTSPKYTTPITVDRATTIKARFFHHDGGEGRTASASFRPGHGDVKNVAPAATATATSQYDDSYSAAKAIDGAVPAKLAGGDGGRAWAVYGPTFGGRAEFTLTWKEPVEIGEIVYFGRTAFNLEECFKDFELYLDDAKEPIVKGTLDKVHGPQRIPVPVTKATKLRFKFLNFFGGHNPGASEIMVFAKTPSDDLLPPH